MPECKRRWNSIRDQLRRTIQKRKTKSGQDAKKRCKYKYENILKFLLPHLIEKDSITNDQAEGYDDSESIAESHDTQDSFNRGVENISHADGHKKEDDQGSTYDTSFHFSLEKHQFATPTAGKNILCEVKPQDISASQLLAYMLAEREAVKSIMQGSQTSTQDPVYAFLSGLAPTLKSLNPMLLNEAKGKLFSVVQELEMRQLQMNANGQGHIMQSYPMPAQSSASSSSSSASSASTTTSETTKVKEPS